MPRVRTNSVFLPCGDDKVEKYKPAPIKIPPSYDPKVKIHDWQLRTTVETPGNDLGKFGRAPYERFGLDDEPIGVSVTREMTQQIHTKKDFEREYRHRGMFNVFSFPYTETEDYKRASKSADLDLPKPIEPTDYRTTLRDDFPPHYPLISKKPSVPDVPWMLYRRILGYGSDDLVRRRGVGKFLDDNMDAQNRAAAMKMSRFVSYDPTNRRYTDTKRFSDALLRETSIHCSG